MGRFRSALGIEDLAAMILQYAMYGREAEKILTADPTLRHLLRDHAKGFPRDVGVEVTGAGVPCANGWYRRKSHEEGPPKGYPGNWAHDNHGRHWYDHENQDCYIHRKFYLDCCFWRLFLVPANSSDLDLVLYDQH